MSTLNKVTVKPCYNTVLSNSTSWSTNNAKNTSTVRQVCLLLTNQFAGFPAPIAFRFAYLYHVLPVNKIREIRPHGHNNLACRIINLLLDVFLCSIAENFFSLFVF